MRYYLTRELQRYYNLHNPQLHVTMQMRLYHDPQTKIWIFWNPFLNVGPASVSTSDRLRPTPVRDSRSAFIYVNMLDSFCFSIYNELLELEYLVLFLRLPMTCKLHYRLIFSLYSVVVYLFDTLTFSFCSLGLSSSIKRI